jgi:predicted Zn-dependent protease
MRRDDRTLSSLGMLCEVKEKTDRGEHKEARELLEQLLREDPRAQSSASVAWNLAIVCDYLEDFEMAYRYVEEALARDPLSVPFNRSFDIIIDRIRGALASEQRAPDDASTPRLYALLVQCGQADSGSHLAMARHHLHAGNATAARRLLEAVTTLEPTNREAWAHLATAARACGEEAAASEAARQAAALEDPLPLFAIPGKAQG